jgi:hypothetical protein
MSPLFSVRPGCASVQGFDVEGGAPFGLFLESSAPVRVLVLTAPQKQRWDRREEPSTVNPSPAAASTYSWFGYVPEGTYYVVIENHGPAEAHAHYEVAIGWPSRRRRLEPSLI